MLFELVKNSLRAVQERFQDADHESPPIRVVVADGVEDVTIKVSSKCGMHTHILGAFRVTLWLTLGYLCCFLIRSWKHSKLRAVTR